MIQTIKKTILSTLIITSCYLSISVAANTNQALDVKLIVNELKAQHPTLDENSAIATALKLLQSGALSACCPLGNTGKIGHLTSAHGHSVCVAGPCDGLH